MDNVAVTSWSWGVGRLLVSRRGSELWDRAAIGSIGRGRPVWDPVTLPGVTN